MSALSVGSARGRGVGWWGLWALVLTEASLFVYLLFAYFYLGAQTHAQWPPDGPPALLLPAFNTGVLLSSSLAVWLAERCVKHANRGGAFAWQCLAIVLGALFVAIQVREWSDKPFSLTSNQYGSLYFTITGFHLAHVVVGLVVLVCLAGWTLAGFFDGRRHSALAIGGLYWHFVDAVWLVVFSALYVTPHVW